MKLYKILALSILLLTANEIVAQEVCLVQSIVVNTGYDPKTGSVLANGQKDPKWIADPASLSQGMINNGATGGQPWIIPHDPNWGPPILGSKYISCFSVNNTPSEPTSSGLTYTVTFDRSFSNCVADTFLFDLSYRQDDNINWVKVDGQTYHEPLNPIDAFSQTFVIPVFKVFLNPGTHKLSFNSQNNTAPNALAVNQFGFDVKGTITGKTASLVGPDCGADFVCPDLPVTFSSVNAHMQNNNIAVEWRVENELNIKQYDVEKSTDGFRFSKVSTLVASGNNLPYKKYSWLDANPVSGNNFYRIRSVGLDGDSKYTQVVRVQLGKGIGGITIYPNPVKQKANLLYTVTKPGEVDISLLDITGKLIRIFIKEHQQAVGDKIAILNFDNSINAGTYMLRVSANGKTENIKIVKE